MLLIRLFAIVLLVSANACVISADMNDPLADAGPAVNFACNNDRVLNDGEECDDGNRRNGDGCSRDCKIEAGCGNGVLEDGEE